MASLRYEAAFDLCGEEPAGPYWAPTSIAQPAPAVRQGGLIDRSRRLAQLVESEIIPRLLIAHSEVPASDDVIDAQLIDKFAYYSISVASQSLLGIVGGLLQRGVSMESIYVDLLAPAARRLGEYWMDDRVSYVDVTIALGRLHQVVRELSVHGDQEWSRAQGARSALFAPAPGEQHTFGLVLIEDFFRRAGWRTWTELTGDPAEIENAAKAHHFDLLGLTAATVEPLDRLSALITCIKRISRNQNIRVFVGGHVFLERPELVLQVGADGMACDARDALTQAEAAVRLIAR